MFDAFSNLKVVWKGGGICEVVGRKREKISHGKYQEYEK